MPTYMRVLECESAVKGRRHSCLDDSAGEDPDQDLEVLITSIYCTVYTMQVLFIAYYLWETGTGTL